MESCVLAVASYHLVFGINSIEQRNASTGLGRMSPHDARSEAKKGALESTKEGTQPLERVKEQKVTSQA